MLQLDKIHKEEKKKRRAEIKIGRPGGTKDSPYQ